MQTDQTPCFRPSSTPAAIFEFYGLIPAGTAIVTFSLTSWLITWFAIRQPDSSVGLLIFLSAMTAFTSFISVVFLNSRSDLVIDTDGIARHLMGKEWQRILWTDVQTIKVFPVFGEKPCRGFNVIPTQCGKFSLMPKGKIAFCDRAKNMDELIDTLNYYVSLHNVKIEVQHRGQLVASTRIER